MLLLHILLLISIFHTKCRSRGGVGGMLTGSDQPIDSWCDDVFVFFLLKHVHSFIVDVGCVVDDIDAVADAHLYGVASACVGAESFA